MNRQRIAKMVRRFLENGIKLLLENPANVRDLLGLQQRPAHLGHGCRRRSDPDNRICLRRTGHLPGSLPEPLPGGGAYRGEHAIRVRSVVQQD